ncbi:unnamed protein product, partial [Didymodactylos carnosus]
MASRMLSPEFE